MIQANELRIFNWIADRGGKQWQIDHWESMNKVSAKPSTSMCMGILIENHPMTEYVDYLYPIPLTEEWLLNAGFTKPAHSWNGEIFHLTEWDEYPLNWCVAMDKNSAVIVLKLKYVHQLQNLYFALTGKELEFKL